MGTRPWHAVSPASNILPQCVYLLQLVSSTDTPLLTEVHS